MSRGDDTGSRPSEAAKLFAKTHWSLVQRAKEDSITALNHLFTQYREPMIVHLLGKSNTRHEAEELVQGFCVHLVNQRDFLGNVAQHKGKFRTFLLNALNNYIRDQIDRTHACKRGEGRQPDSLDETRSEERRVG